MIQTDHKPLLEIVTGTAKVQNSAAAKKLCRWTHDIMATTLPPRIEYKKGSLNLITDSLSRLSTHEHYEYNIPLENTEPIHLDMVQTRTGKAKQGTDASTLPELWVKVRDIFQTSDKEQLIQDADKILDEISPVKLRELQDKDKLICAMRKSKKFKVITDENNVL